METVQVDTVICMSPEEREWSISIAGVEDNQECGDVIYLIELELHIVSTPTLAQECQVLCNSLCSNL